MEFIVFRPLRLSLDQRFTLKLNRTTLYESPKIKYLGLILDNSLLLKFHILSYAKNLVELSAFLAEMKRHELYIDNYCTSRVILHEAQPSVIFLYKCNPGGVSAI